QAGNADRPFGLGLVPYPRARAGTVRWIAAWTGRPAPQSVVAEFKRVSDAVAWVRDDTGPYGYRVWPRTERVCHLGGPGQPVLVGPFEAWLAAYAPTRGCSGRVGRAA